MLSSIAISVTHASQCVYRKFMRAEGESCSLNDYAVRPVESIEM